jgi:hypothetical protein
VSKSTSLKDLQKVWYRKLKESGFQDIERENDPDSLKIASINVIGRPVRGRRLLSREVYFQLAGVFYHHHEFKDEDEKRIWELHAEGLSHREITATLKARYGGVKGTKYTKYGRQRVWRTIRLLADQMLKENNEDDGFDNS